ncbi:hypothetical protein [Streptomyces rimosus]
MIRGTHHVNVSSLRMLVAGRTADRFGPVRVSAVWFLLTAAGTLLAGSPASAVRARSPDPGSAARWPQAATTASVSSRSRWRGWSVRCVSRWFR